MKILMNCFRTRFFKSSTIFNIGSNHQIGLMEFIEIIENNLNIKQTKPCELPGDVLSTFANTDSFNWVVIKQLLLLNGMAEFIKWYLHYYNAYYIPNFQTLNPKATFELITFLVSNIQLGISFF